uniref:Uncharacterized protein n=1 Tax=Rhizophora mucronata TaxID=61149 RepID=A0A2P2QXG5_RHIMU
MLPLQLQLVRMPVPGWLYFPHQTLIIQATHSRLSHMVAV